MFDHQSLFWISIILKKSSKNLYEMSFSNKKKNQCVRIYKKRESFFQGNCILFHPFLFILYITHGTFFISRKFVALSRFVIFHEAVEVCVKKKPRGWYYANGQSMGRAIKTRMTNDGEWHLCLTSFGIMMGIQCKNRCKTQGILGGVISKTPFHVSDDHEPLIKVLKPWIYLWHEPYKITR